HKERLPTEEECVEEIFGRMKKLGLVKCHRCGASEVEHKCGQREIRCSSCKRLSWFTSGTIFHRMRKALPWVIAICMLEHQVNTSAFRFHKLVGGAYSSALAVFRKLMIVIEGQMGDEATAVFSGLFSDVFCKRSRVTPARAHPRNEQDEFDKYDRGQQE